MTETEPETTAIIDKRLHYTCGSHCCAVFKGEAKDIPFMRFMIHLDEGPWLNLNKIHKLLYRVQRKPQPLAGCYMLEGDLNMLYGRCALDQLFRFALQHDAKNKPRSWFTDAAGRLILQVNGECFGIAHYNWEEKDFDEWFKEATSDTCSSCNGEGRTWHDWDPNRTVVERA